MVLELSRIFSYALEKGTASEWDNDLARVLAYAFTEDDWVLKKARMSYNEDGKPTLLVVLGLRASILSGFDKYDDLPHAMFLPCDIFALVPVVGLIRSKLTTGLAAGAIERNDSGTFAVLAFEGTGENTASRVRDISLKVTRFTHRWKQWVSVIENTLKDSAVGQWLVDWREFLAGVSGFELMPWFPSLSLNEWAIGIESVTKAATTLLHSVLSLDEMNDPVVRDVLNWLDELALPPGMVTVPRMGVEGVV